MSLRLIARRHVDGFKGGALMRREISTEYLWLGKLRWLNQVRAVQYFIGRVVSNFDITSKGVFIIQTMNGEKIDTIHALQAVWTIQMARNVPPSLKKSVP